MEYKVFHYLRNNSILPYVIRLCIGVFIIFISLIPIILPIFPGSLFLGIAMGIVGFMFFISARKVRHVIKLRKSIIHLSKNIHKKHIIRQKMRDIKIHIRDILSEKNN